MVRVQDRDFLNNIDKIVSQVQAEAQALKKKKTFIVTIDVTMSGDLEIEADSEKQARAIAMNKTFIPSDLRFFHFLHNEIYDCREADD